MLQERQTVMGSAVRVRVTDRAGLVARTLFWLFAYYFGWALLSIGGLTPR